MEIICFSANVRQFSIAYSVVHVQVCFKYFLGLLLYFSLAGQGSDQFNKAFICASGWFVLPAGLYFRLVCTDEK